jgi:tetratricopeptide (TPR) repeat protein
MVFWDRFRTTIATDQSEKNYPIETDPCEDQTFTPRFKEKKINVFVSSTFKDMQAERDELTLQVFPALRKVCEERGIAWGEVDLRWGIPEEKKGEVLNICLKFIDDCRPYFIGILGERYGWVDPNALEKAKDDYPWLKKEHADRSITELEILHGVLNNPAMANHAYFYFRNPGYVDTIPIDQRHHYVEGPTPEEITKYGPKEAESRAEKRRGQLTALKETIRKAKVPIQENYPDPVQFGNLVHADLMRVIDSLAPPGLLKDEEGAPAWLDREERAHEAFAASRFGVYIPRQEYFDRLDTHAKGDGPPLLVLGESGSGKSALLAHWAFRFRNLHQDDLVLVHFIGASSESTDWASMLRRIMGEFKRKFSLTEDIPEKEEALMAAFRNWLYMAAAHGRVVLVIDALNQLEDRHGSSDLIWLPLTIPANIRLIISTLPGPPLDAARERKWPEMTVEPLTISERKALITCYLKMFHKELSQLVEEELAAAPQCQNPLFLQALLEEIRIHGVFEKITGQIRDYLTVPTVVGLYEKILARYERDYKRDRPGLVKDTAALLWAARRGLSKAELMDLLGEGRKPLPDAYWAPLYLAMEHSLVVKGGRFTFFHDYLRKAVENYYLSRDDEKQHVHQQIADYFMAQPDSYRRIEELPWQLAEAGEWNRLSALLSNPDFFKLGYILHEYDMKNFWTRIEKNSKNCMISAYDKAVNDSSGYPIEFLWSVRDLLSTTGHFDEALKLGTYLIQFAVDHDDINSLQTALGNQALMYMHKGNLDLAMQLHKEEEQLCRHLGRLECLQRSLGNQALILRGRGNLDGAIALLKEKESICRNIGNVNGVHASRGNQALILQDRGYLNEALQIYQDQEKFYRQMGDLDGLQRSLGNQAGIHFNRGDLEKALTLLKANEKICLQIGDVDSLQKSYGDQALIIKARGNLNGAMKLLDDQEDICRKIENFESLSDCLYNKASIYSMACDPERAMRLLKEHEQICRKLGNPGRLASSLGNQAVILTNRGNLTEALDLLKEQEEISRKMGDLEGLQRSLGNQALIFKDFGNTDEAMKLLKENESICREISDFESLAISLINQALLWQEKGQGEEAQNLALEAYEFAKRCGATHLENQIKRDLQRMKSR